VGRGAGLVKAVGGGGGGAAAATTASAGAGADAGVGAGAGAVKSLLFPSPASPASPASPPPPRPVRASKQIASTSSTKSLLSPSPPPMRIAIASIIAAMSASAPPPPASTTPSCMDVDVPDPAAAAVARGGGHPASLATSATILSIEDDTKASRATSKSWGASVEFARASASMIVGCCSRVVREQVVGCAAAANEHGGGAAWCQMGFGKKSLKDLKNPKPKERRHVIVSSTNFFSLHFLARATGHHVCRRVPLPRGERPSTITILYPRAVSGLSSCPSRAHTTLKRPPHLFMFYAKTDGTPSHPPAHPLSLPLPPETTGTRGVAAAPRHREAAAASSCRRLAHRHRRCLPRLRV
jgi:hypothetical protein